MPKKTHLESPKPPEDKKKNPAVYLKYAGFGVEMATGIIVPTLIGQKIDQRMGNDKLPIFTLLLAAFGMVYVFYRLYKFSSN
jgi:hypothetical protein